jgi:hypothetical protein
LSVFDTEGDSLRPTKFHVVSYQDGESITSLTTHAEMKEWLESQDLLIAHNCSQWDIPELTRVLGCTIKAQVIDTLALSWYLFPERVRHGLESWGEDFGVPKPPITDWENLSLEDYVHRCEEDVKINIKLWNKQRKYLSKLYLVPEEEVVNLPIIKYLSFKMNCAAMQKKSKWRLDVDFCKETLAKLIPAKQEREEALRLVLPPTPTYAKREPPAKPYKKDGTPSVTGARWLELMRQEGLPEGYTEPVKVIVGYEPPKPTSHAQLKDWLFSLGWEPATFKYVREDDGTQRAIPQIQAEDEDKNKILCPSVELLAEREPAVSALLGLFVINHRISILEGFLENEKDEFLEADIQGLTNTLRFKHKVIVNLPGVDKTYGKEIRGCLIAKEGYELCGSDMNSLEDMTKRHYMFEFDPEYVIEMSAPGFDPHLDLAKHAGVVTQKQIDQHNIDKAAKKVSAIAHIRKPFKVTNYSATYGIGAPKLARTMGVAIAEAKRLLEAFWKRNWAIRRVAETQKTKTVNDQMWLFNPVSKFWYTLRNERDVFSTLNQGTGVYCFDTWLGFVLKQRPQLTAQFHDEAVWEIKQGHREDMEKIILSALDKTNNKLKLNVTLGVDIQFGQSYAEIH